MIKRYFESKLIQIQQSFHIEILEIHINDMLNRK